MNFTNLKEYIDKLVTEYKVPGADCIVYKNHEEIFRYYAGKKDIEENKPITGDELYLIFSMTKMLTCTAALQLWEKGKFNLDDKLSCYMPEFEKLKVKKTFDVSSKGNAITTGATVGETVVSNGAGYAKTPVTIRHLFTMSAGFNYDLNAEYIKNTVAEGKTSTRQIAGCLCNTVLGFEPGSHFQYSLCHDILGALVEIWSGQKLGDYMCENIFKPLGMNNTFFGVDKNRTDDYAARYIYDADGNPQRLPLECLFNLSEEYQSGGAGLTSCTEDYALFLDALASGGVGKSGAKILSADTVKLMGTNQLDKVRYEDFQALRPGYGYGLGVRTHVNPEVSGSLSPIGEFGWDGAAGAFSMVDMENEISLTYFQHIHSWPLKIQTEMRNVLYECLGNN